MLAEEKGWKERYLPEKKFVSQGKILKCFTNCLTDHLGEQTKTQLSEGLMMGKTTS